MTSYDVGESLDVLNPTEVKWEKQIFMTKAVKSI